MADATTEPGVTPEEHVPRSGPDLKAIRQNAELFDELVDDSEILALLDYTEALITALHEMEWNSEGVCPLCDCTCTTHLAAAWGGHAGRCFFARTGLFTRTDKGGATNPLHIQNSPVAARGTATPMMSSATPEERALGEQGDIHSGTPQTGVDASREPFCGYGTWDLSTLPEKVRDAP